MGLRKETRRQILKAFWDRELPMPEGTRLQRLIWEHREGRSIESIEDGLDSYLQSQFAVSMQGGN